MIMYYPQPSHFDIENENKFFDIKFENKFLDIKLDGVR